MNGLYLHIPFCQKRCIYCDFYSTTCGADVRSRFVEALCREMALRADYLPSRSLQSLYIGGGTPSQLLPAEIERIFQAVGRLFRLAPDAEVTMEANPDDVTPAFLAALGNTPVNRLSMGVQTFDDAKLSLLNRRHTARQALETIDRCVRSGYENLSIDLIYGLPGETLPDWRRDLDRALSLPVTHLSAYALIYEEGTRLWQMREERRVAEAPDELSLRMFELLMDRTAEAGMEHYEISNFCRPGHRAVHNAGYWHGMRYLGCGPSAHSYDGQSRQWNKADLDAYIRSGGDVVSAHLYEREVLTPAMRRDECVMTALRTADGLRLSRFEADFGPAACARLLRDARPHLEQGRLERLGDTLRLTRSGIFLSDGIMSDLMSDEEE